jgi:hypothetical protein
MQQEFSQSEEGASVESLACHGFDLALAKIQRWMWRRIQGRSSTKEHKKSLRLED